jgi:hypothetical protein
MQIYILFNCVICDAENFVFDGNPKNPYSQRAEGFRCWNCESNQKIDLDSYELNDCSHPMQPGREFIKSKSSDIQIDRGDEDLKDKKKK